MPTLNVLVRHRRTEYPVEVDLETTGDVFKMQLYTLTNVEPARQKVIIRTFQLQDDQIMGDIGLRDGQRVILMGTPSDNAENDLIRPPDKIEFIDGMAAPDMVPAGLINLGNTCYMNSTLQAMRSIPELQAALFSYQPNRVAGQDQVLSNPDLVVMLGRLYHGMARSQTSIAPIGFLGAVRAVFPQFAQRNTNGEGYAQQDAEEAWTELLSLLNRRVTEDGQTDSLVSRYMTGELTSVTRCEDEHAIRLGESRSYTTERFTKLSCHIDARTNHLRDSIVTALNERLSKHCDLLDRDASYTKMSQISRLPKYMTVHFVRFFWKRDVQRKAKILRKVTFPLELDVIEFCTPELRRMMIPVRDKIREIRKDEEDVARWRNRPKVGTSGSTTPQANAAILNAPLEEGTTYKTDAQLEAEREASLEEAKRTLHDLVNPTLAADVGSNLSGLYELRAVITHRGASADSGHYTAFVRKTALSGYPLGDQGRVDHAKWWWLNDHRVTEVDNSQVEALAGGGESHSALMLLYSEVALPEPDQQDDDEEEEEEEEGEEGDQPTETEGKKTAKAAKQ